jgi:hypothetical protein
VYGDAIALDRTGPVVSGVSVSLREAALGDASASAGPSATPSAPAELAGASLPIELAWEAVDAEAGLSDAAVEWVCDEGGTTATEAPGSAAPGESTPWTAAVLLPAGRCQVSVVGRDGVGNATRASAVAVETTLLSLDLDDTPTATVQGDQVGVIAERGPDRGRAAIVLDGEPLGLVDLYAPEPSGPQVVYVTGLQPDALQQVSVEATGTSDPSATASSVVIDGFVTLALADGA